MKKIILATIATILIISCNYKNIKLEKNDMFWHKYGYGYTKWIVVDTLPKGVIAYSERWLPRHAEYVSYTELSFASGFKKVGKYQPVKDTIEKEKVIDRKIYSSIVQKVSVKSHADNEYYVTTQVWCDNKQRTSLSLEYWGQKVVSENRIESVKRSEYAKAERIKARVDRKLKSFIN